MHCLPCALFLAASLTACAGPPSHLTRLWPEGESGVPILGLSTEDGILILAEHGQAVGDRFRLQFPVGNSVVQDWAVMDRRNDDLAIVRPITSRLHEGRFATVVPAASEVFYLALRDDDDKPVMVEVDRWHNGMNGAFLAPIDNEPERMAREWAGTGLYVERDGRWEIVGILAGITARMLNGSLEGDVGMGYLDLAEISRLLPDQIDYFEHPILPPRPDFEFGVPLQEGDVDIDALLSDDVDEEAIPSS
jgi:hypothetical protein